MDYKKMFVRPEELQGYEPPGHSGTVNYRLIGEDVVGAKKFEVVLGKLSVGGAAHRHSHPDLEHGYYLLKGKCIIEVGGESQEIQPGMAVFVPQGVEHELTVLEPVEVLVFYAPPLYKKE
ncbi:MAG: cupin domain-containing protein [Syntrophomonadaceae bacterium]|jgi:quercetin dioxygenase-like cupin family protein